MAYHNGNNNLRYNNSHGGRGSGSGGGGGGGYDDRYQHREQQHHPASYSSWNDAQQYAGGSGSRYDGGGGGGMRAWGHNEQRYDDQRYDDRRGAYNPALYPSSRQREREHDRDRERGRDSERERDRERDRERERGAERRAGRGGSSTTPYVRPRTIDDLLRPFSDVPRALPPRAVLSAFLGPAASAADATPAEAIAAASARGLNPAAFRWTPGHAQALDALLAAASAALRAERELAAEAADGEDDAGMDADARAPLAQLKDKQACATALVNLAGVAHLARKFGANSALAAAPAPTISAGWTKTQMDKALDLLYDFCEAVDDQVRTIGYAALGGISYSAPSVLRRNADVLCQLLAVPDAAERKGVVAALRSLLALAPAATVETILGPETRAARESRTASLEFLADEACRAPPPSKPAEQPRTAAAYSGAPISIRGGSGAAQAHGPAPGAAGADDDLPTLAQLLGDSVDLQQRVARCCALVLREIVPGAEATDVDADEDAAAASANRFEEALEALRAVRDLLTGGLPDAAAADGADSAAAQASSLLTALFLPEEDFASRGDWLRARRATRLLMDALAVKSLEKMTEVLALQASTAPPPAGNTATAATGPDPADLGEEAAFFRSMADDASKLLDDVIEQDAQSRKSKADDEDGMDVDADADASGDTAAQATEPFAQRTLVRLLSWLCVDEPVWAADAQDARRSDVQATYEHFRQHVLPHQPSPKDRAQPLASALQLFSPPMRPIVLRCGGAAALSRRRDAAAHGSPGAHDVTMSVSMAAALLFAAPAPPPDSALDPNNTDALEAAEAALWALSISIPIRPKPVKEKNTYPTDTPAAQKAIGEWNKQSLTFAEGLSSVAAVQRAFLSSLVRSVTDITAQLLLPPAERRALDARPVWLPPRMRTLTAATIEGKAPGAPLIAGSGRVGIKRRAEEEVGRTSGISLRGAATSEPAREEKRARTIFSVVAGTPTAVVSIKGASGGAAGPVSVVRPSGSGGLAIRGRTTVAADATPPPASPTVTPAAARMAMKEEAPKPAVVNAPFRIRDADERRADAKNARKDGMPEWFEKRPAPSLAERLAGGANSASAGKDKQTENWRPRGSAKGGGSWRAKR